ncbi:MAG: T9SS C-terminal target domain-containing protein [Cytophagales bacterium]|nr:MAG: T9SS C-terminal target domain-containing protein [Cytophagales bacterium]
MKNKYLSRQVQLLVAFLFFLFLVNTAQGQVPSISSFTPTSGVVGTTVTITGTNFNATAANNSVYFGAIKVTPTAGSATSLTVTVPAGATSVTPIIVQDKITGLQASSMETIIGTTTRQFTVTNTPNLMPNYTKTDYATNNFNPRSVAIGDFNGDGKADFAAANYGSNNVSIRLGDGMGGFSGTTTVAVGSNPQSVAIGDFNGDGKADLATANNNFSSSTVSIRLGDGLGGFSGTTTVAVGNDTYSVVIGDFNGDGRADLATTNWGSNNVSIRLGDGLGGFSGTATVAVGASPQSIAIGDFNGDGKADLATANENSGNVSIRLGNGLGGFTGTTTVAVGIQPCSVAIGDFNGDGKADFATANIGSANVSIRLGDGLGGFSGTTTVSVGTGPRSVAIGDFNGDGKADFATANWNSSSNNVSIRLGDGLGGFSGTTTVAVGTNPWSVAIGDFNGDGKADIASTNAFSANVSVLLYTPLSFPPTLSALSPLNIQEDAGLQTVNLLGITDGGEGGQTLTITATSDNTALVANPTITYTSPNTTGTLNFTSLADANGTATISVNVNDGVATITKTFLVTVTAVNDAPIFTKGSNPNVQINAGNQSFTAWATAVSDGDPEITQVLSFTLTNDNAALFSVQPAISPSGDLTFTPAAGQLGLANLTVMLTDDGSSVLPNVNESAVQNFTISVVNTNNQAPVFTKGADQLVLEDAGAQSITAWATGIDDGDPSLNQQLTFEIVSNSNPNLFSVPPAISENGTLTYTSAPNANGVANISIRLKDNGLGTLPNVNVSANQSFSITVNAINDVPIFAKGDNISIQSNQNSTSVNAQSFGAWAKNIDDGDPELTQVLTFELTNDNNAIFEVQPALNPNGTLTFTPKNTVSNGKATVTILLKDNGSNVMPNVNQTAPQTFTITIFNPLNDAPTFDLGTAITVNENSGLQTIANFATNIDDGDPEIAQGLGFVVTNDKNDLFSQQPTIQADGTLTFAAKPNANGTVEVSVVLVDDGATALPNVNKSELKKFTIHITPINLAPTFSLNREGQYYYYSENVQYYYYNYWYNTPFEILNYNTDGAVSRENFAIHIEDGEPELVQVLTFEVSNDNNALFTVQPFLDANGRLIYAVAPQALGTANVTVVLKDDGSNVPPNSNTSTSRTFKITVRGKNIVYFDENNNGVRDANEPIRANALVKLNDFRYAYSNAKGEYDAYSNGNYTIAPLLPPNFTSSNPINYTGNQIGWLAGKDFGLVGKPTKDVAIYTWNGSARPGFNTYYYIFYQNRGDKPQSGNIAFTFDERLEYIQTLYGNAPVFINGNNLVYRYENLQAGEYGVFLVHLKVPVREDFILGQTRIYAHTSINMNEGEVIFQDDVPDNNDNNHCMIVRNSYDPNDKQVSPAGNISPEFVADREFLTYTVRFQNEGTAEAIRVEVRDTLSNFLDFSTIEILGASHTFNFLLTGNQAVWHFENINLPPKRDNELGSIGFFTFRIKPKANVIVGNEIVNRSGIYFDFNPPIITNSVKTKVVEDMEAPFIVSLSPENNAKDVPTTKKLFLSFNEKVVKGIGEILLLEDGALKQTIDVRSSKVSVTNEIVFIDNAVFAKDKTITVKLAQGTFTDVKRNVFAGLNDWTFNQVVRVPLVPVLTAQAENKSVTLTWSSTEDKNITYEIYMYSANTPQRLVGSTSKGSFKVEGLSNGITYYFRIKTINTFSGVQSGFSETISVRPSVVLSAQTEVENYDFQLYPNPSKDRFTLEGKLKEATNLQMTVFDMTGRKVYEQSRAKTSYLKTEIDLGNLPSGLYILVISGDTQKLQISKKMVKEN